MRRMTSTPPCTPGNAGGRTFATPREKSPSKPRPEGEVLRIPCGTSEVLYRFNAGEIRRQVASSDFSELLLPTVKASQMVMDARGPVSAWRWELELKSRRKEARLPLLFTFEAAAKPTP